MEWNDSKSSALIKLKEAGFNVPDVFVITPEEFSHFLKFNNLYNNYTETDLMEGELPPELMDRLSSIISSSGLPLACRTSAVAEDGLEFSFAGQFRSLMGISSLAEAEVALKYCWAGTISQNISGYYEFTNLQYYQHKLPSVFFQPMISSKTSGIMFYSRKSGMATIESNWGMGESLAAGISDADRITVDLANPNVFLHERVGKVKAFIFYVKDTSKLVLGQHLSLNIHGKNFGVKLLSKGPLGHTIRVDLIRGSQYVTSIDKTVTAKLLVLARKIHDLFNVDIDIEWCMDSQQILHIVQVRPISTKQKIDRKFFDYDEDKETVLSAGKASGILMDKSNIGEKSNPFILAGQEFVPTDTSSILKAEGVLTATGGILSHVAIVCRELGIPCIHVLEHWDELPFGKFVELNTFADQKIAVSNSNTETPPSRSSSNTTRRFVRRPSSVFSLYDIFSTEVHRRLGL